MQSAIGNKGRRSRAGLSLLELVLSIASASMLMAGMGTAIYLSAQAHSFSTVGTDGLQQRDVGLSLMRTELSEAVEVTAQTADTLTVIVPDRNADGSNETITYEYDDTSSPYKLTRSVNGASAKTLLTNLSSWSFSGLSRTVSAETTTAVLTPTNAPHVEDVVIVAANSNTNSINIPTTAGNQVGDLLIAVLSVCEGSEEDTTAPSGWTEIVDYEHDSEDNLLYVASKISTGDEDDHLFYWYTSRPACAMLIRISNVSSSATYSVVSVSEGTGNLTASCPDATTPNPNTLLLKLGSFGSEDIISRTPGSSGDKTLECFAASQGSRVISLSGCFRSVPTASTISGQQFTTTDSSLPFVTCTLAIQPAGTTTGATSATLPVMSP